jgi:ATP-dependent protease ClpP protease subunit
MKVDLAKVRALAEQAREFAVRTQNYSAGPRRGARSWFKIENRVMTTDGGAATPTTDIYLYDAIGEWGVTAQDFLDALRGVTSPTITLYVNCEGGEVFDGLAIYEALRRHPADITARIDGIAASMASVVVMAANRVIMAERGRIMIHDAHGGALGGCRDMYAMGDLLNALSETIADIYAEKTGKTSEEMRAAMQAADGGPDGTWYDAKSALKAKLIDAIAGGDEPANALPVVPGRPADIPAAIEAGDVPVWDAAAFLGVLQEVEHPAEPLEIPTGPALFDGLRLP